MKRDLQSIFESITPDNIKDIPVIQDSMEIFIETLQELSKESIEIRNIFQNDLIREELVKIYLDDLYNVLQQVQLNTKIVDIIDSINEIAGTQFYNKDAILNIATKIRDEHFLTFKSYKEKKGTKVSLKYMYDLVNVFLQSDNTLAPLNIEEIDPFSINLTGSMPSYFYEGIVKPLAHPLGFTYFYAQVLNLALQDFFPQELFTYTVKVLEVRCLKPDGTRYVTNYATNNGVPRVVTNLITSVTDYERTKTIKFKDGTYLYQVTNNVGQTHVYYKDANDDVIIAYTDQCSVYFTYSFNVITTVTDEFDFKPTTVVSETHNLSTEVSEIANYIERSELTIDNVELILNTSESTYISSSDTLSYDNWGDEYDDNFNISASTVFDGEIFNETLDSDIDTVQYIDQEWVTYEYYNASDYAIYIGAEGFYIGGNGVIGAGLLSTTVQAEPYQSLTAFNIFSDSNFEFNAKDNFSDDWELTTADTDPVFSIGFTGGFEEEFNSALDDSNFNININISYDDWELDSGDEDPIFSIIFAPGTLDDNYSEPEEQEDSLINFSTIVENHNLSTEVQETKYSILTLLQEQNSWSEYDLSESTNVIGAEGFYIGIDQVIGYVTQDFNEFAEPYYKIGAFDTFADDDWTFGVYRNGELLTDNNVSALA